MVNLSWTNQRTRAGAESCAVDGSFEVAKLAIGFPRELPKPPQARASPFLCRLSMLKPCTGSSVARIKVPKRIPESFGVGQRKGNRGDHSGDGHRRRCHQWGNESLLATAWANSSVSSAWGASRSPAEHETRASLCNRSF